MSMFRPTRFLRQPTILFQACHRKAGITPQPSLFPDLALGVIHPEWKTSSLVELTCLGKLAGTNAYFSGRDIFEMGKATG